MFLAEVARGEKDLAVAAGRLSTIFRFDKEYAFGILSQLICSQTFTLSFLFLCCKTCTCTYLIFYLLSNLKATFNFSIKK